MSGISLSHFLEIARLGTDSEVRMASGDVGKVLVNKGMLEHRLGTLLGMGDVSTRDQRNAAAVDAFREALTRRFGVGNTDEALKLAGYTEGTALTGRVIVDAHCHAGHLEKDNLANNHRILERTEILHDDQNVIDTFAARFADNLKASTRNYRDALDPADLKALEKTTAKQVTDLENADKLEDSGIARKALSDAMQSVLTSIANKEKPTDLLAKLMDARARQETLAAIEREAAGHEGPGKDMRVATFDALTKLGTSYSRFVEDLRKHSLSDNSSLRALYVAADDVLNDANATDQEKRQADALKDQCEALLNDIIAADRPHTESQEGDIALLQQGDTVNDRQLGIARGAVNRMLGIEKIAISQFVDFASQSPDGQIGWKAGQLFRVAPEDQVSIRAALEKFEEALTGRHGERIAQHALEHGLQDQNGFNGNVVIEAEKHTLKLVDDNRDIYRQIVRGHRREGDEETVTTCNRRFEEVLEVRSDGYHRSLTKGLGPDDSDEQAQTLASEVESQVSKLAELGRLEASNKARQRLSDALLDAVTAIVNRPDPGAVEKGLGQAARKRDNFEQLKDLLVDVPETVARQETAFLLVKLRKVDECLAALQEIEAETGVQSGGEKLQIATIDAVRRFLGATGNDFFDLFDKGRLSQSSPFRALYAAAREVAQDDDASEAQRARARTLMEQWEQLATTFVAMTTPTTQTRSDNLNCLLERPADELRLDAARRGLARHLEPLADT